jgi:hypothetical protein
MVLVGAVGVVNGGAARRCVRRPAAAMVMVRSLSPGLLRVREYGNMEIWKYGIWKYMEVYGKYMEVYGSIWKNMEVYGSIWRILWRRHLFLAFSLSESQENSAK